MTESYIITGPVSTVGFTIILCLFDDDPWRSCFVTVNFWLRPGIYALTWKNIHSYCSWVSYSQPWYSFKIIHQIRWGTLIPHLSVLRLTSALGLGIYSLTWRTYILIVHEFPVLRLGPIPRLSVRLGEEHYSLIRLSSAWPLPLTSRLINRATLSPFLTWTKKSLELYI